MGFSQIEEKMQNHTHICHQCGWGYPKPHPSAKQRRAHKKVCGKQQGFLLHESQGNGGGGDDQEDDDIKDNGNGKKRGGNGLYDRQVSSKSEEEEYSDTFTEFVESDLQASNGGNIQPLDTPSDNSSSRIPRVSKNVGFQLGTCAETQNHFSSSTINFAADFSLEKKDKSSALSLTKEADSSLGEVSENAQIEDMGSCKNKDFVPHTMKDVYAEGKNNSNENLSATQASPSESASGGSEVVMLQPNGLARDIISSDITNGNNTDESTLPMYCGMDSKEMETNTLEQKMSPHECGSNSSGEVSAGQASPSDSVSEEVIATSQTIDGLRRDGTLPDVADCSTTDALTLQMDQIVDPKEMEIDSMEQKMFLSELGSTVNGNSLSLQEESDIVVTSPKMDEPARDRIWSDINARDAVAIPIDGTVDWKEPETSNMDKSMLQSKVGGSEDVHASEDTFQVEVNCASQSNNNYRDDCNDGCNVEKANKSLPVEEVPEDRVKDSEENNPVKSVVSPKTDCGEELKESNIQNTISEDACSDFQQIKMDNGVNMSPLATWDLEGNCQQDAPCSKRLVKEVSIGREADISEAKGVNKGLELHESGARRYSTACDTTFSHTKTNQVDPHYSQQVESFSSLPEIINAVTRKNDDLHEVIIRDITDKADSIGEGAIDENSIPKKIDCNTSSFPIELKENSEKAKGTVLESITDSSAMVIDSSQFENTEGSLSDSQYLHGDNYCGNSNELDKVETSICETEYVEFVGADDNIEKPLQEEGKFGCSSETETFQSGTNNTAVEQLKPATGNSVPCFLNSSSLEDGARISSLGDSSDVFTQCSKENENFSLETQLKAMAVVLLDGSVGSVSQADSIEGSWGSVSDGTVPSLRGAVNSSSVHAAGQTLLGTDSQAPKDTTESESRRSNEQSASEIQPIQNQQQSHSTSLQASTNESNEGKKNKEQIIEKVENWNSSSTVRAPLKSFLVDPFLESTAETTFQGHPKPPTYEDGATSTFQATTSGPEVSTNNSLKRNIEKEWNSPARLPNRSQKRKIRWAPFFCCSPVN